MFLIVVNLVAARAILVPCDIQVDTLPPRGPAVNRCVKRFTVACNAKFLEINVQVEIG